MKTPGAALRAFGLFEGHPVWIESHNHETPRNGTLWFDAGEVLTLEDLCNYRDAVEQGEATANSMHCILSQIRAKSSASPSGAPEGCSPSPANSAVITPEDLDFNGPLMHRGVK